jgi:hypothetical protein
MVFWGLGQEQLLFCCSTGTLIRHNEHIVRIRRLFARLSFKTFPIAHITEIENGFFYKN